MSGPLLILSLDDRITLLELARDLPVDHRKSIRARAVLLAAEGRANKTIAEEVCVTERSVTRWKAAFRKWGATALVPRQRHALLARNAICPSVVMAIRAIAHDQQNALPGAHHWTTRLVARKFGVSAASVWRIWRANGLPRGAAESSLAQYQVCEPKEEGL